MKARTGLGPDHSILKFDTTQRRALNKGSVSLNIYQSLPSWMMGDPRYRLCSVSPLPQKEKKESENHVVTLDWGSWGLTSKGLPKAATTPGMTITVDDRDQYALRVKSNQSRKKSRCPEIMRTGPELVSTAPITGDQGLFTDIEKHQ